MGRYYEELEVGQTFVTEKRTISNADILAFAELSGDHNKLHVDEEYARTTPFKTRIAHGPLGFAVATGLSYSTGLLDGTTLALEASNSRVWSGVHYRFDIEAGETLGATVGKAVVARMQGDGVR